MPTKYSDRLNMPKIGISEVGFTTKNGLKIANGYMRVKLAGKPMIEFIDSQVVKENISIPANQEWKIKNKAVEYIEYRSRDYCGVKIFKRKSNGKFYISPFDLISDKFPVLISPLLRKKTILVTA